MSASMLRTLRAAAPAARSASRTTQVAGRRAASSSASPLDVSTYKFSSDMPWAIGSALVFIPVIAYAANDLKNSSIWDDHAHGHDDHDVHHAAKEDAVDNTQTKGTPKNAQKEMRSNEAPIENSKEAASAAPRSSNGPDEKSTESDRKNSDRPDPVAERSPESATGQPAPKSLQEVTGKSIKETHASDDTKAEQPGSIPESKEQKGIKGSEAHREQTGQLAEGEKHDHVKEEEAGTAKAGSETEKVDKKETKEETKSDEPTEKEIEASTEQALESDGDPAAAKKHEESS